MAHRNVAESFAGELRKAYPVDKKPSFSALLHALDEADRERWSNEQRQKALRKLQRA